MSKLKRKTKGTLPTTDKERYTDPARVAYMLSWRDRQIKNLGEQIGAYQELATLMEALLAFSLFRIARPDERAQSFCAEIPKEELRSMLANWRCEVSDGEGAFTVRFVGKESEEHGKESTEG